MAELFGRVGVHSRITVQSEALALVKPAGATAILIQPEKNPIRYTLDGSSPSRENGFPIQPGDQVVIPVVGDSQLKVSSSTSGTKVQTQWGKYEEPS